MKSGSVVFELPSRPLPSSTFAIRKLLQTALLACAIAAAAPSVGAGELYWDANGNDPGAGITPTGTWGIDPFWNPLLYGTGLSGDWVPGEYAVFCAGGDATGSYIVGVSGAQSAIGVRLEDGDLTLAGGAVTLSGTAILNVGAGLTLTMNSQVAGSVGWTKSGPGTLVLVTNTAATGTRNIIDGVVSIDISTRIPASGNVTLNGGAIRQTNPGNAGSFLQAGTALVIGPGGGTVDYTSSGAGLVSIYAGTITGPGNVLTKSGLHEFRYQGAGLPNTTYGKLVVNQGLFRLGFAASTSDERGFGAVPAVATADAITLDGGSIGTSFSITLHPNRGITLAAGGGAINTSAAELNVPGNITGPGGLAKNTAGNLTLSGQNTFAGDFTINAGGVRFNGDATAGTGAIIVSPTGTITLRNLAPVLTSTLTNPITLNANNGFDIDLTAAIGNTFTLSGPISGPGYMTRGRATGAGGSVVLSGDNSGWSGGLYLHRGIIVLGHKNALGSAPFSITPPTNATPDAVSVQASVPLTGLDAVPNQVILNTNVTLGGVNGLEFAGLFWLSNLTRTVTVTNDSIISGIISGDAGAGLVKSGSGALTLTADNNYSGDTLVSAGTLRVANGVGSATGPGAVTIGPGGTLTGPGSVAGTVTLDGTISPGTSPGTINTPSEVWNGGGSYIWEINAPTSGAGADPGHDLINITGGLTINATPASRFNVKITSLTPANEPGAVDAFDNTFEYVWTILTTTTGITGFDRAAFNLDTSGFANPLANGGFAIETGNDGKDLVLRFLQLPMITSQPMNQTGSQGDMVSLNVTATGSPELAYQWRKEGVNLTGENLATLTFFSLQPSHAGNYDVVVSNAGGSATSSVATVTVLFAPTISAQPQSQTVFVTSNATFSVTAAGNPAPSYQWRFNAADSLGETASTLTINNAQPANEGPYTVVLSNSMGSVTSSVASLTLFRDFGDAADPMYPTLLANNGARHLIVAGFHLGTNVDAEVDGQPDSTATLDDSNGTADDEDGVVFTTARVPGQMATVEVVASADGKLDAWIDFNADGDWADVEEQIFTNVSLTAGTNVLNFTVPLSALTGSASSRFRFSSAGNLSYTGEAADGEVEDYTVGINAAADLALTKGDSPDPVAVSSNLTFTITVTNIGPSQATAVTVTDNLPMGVTFGSASSSQGSCAHAAGVVTCDLGSLSANGSATVTILVVPTASGSVSNFAAVAAAETDLNLANNSASTETTVKDPPIIVSQPTSTAACPGATAMFSVTASGTPPLSYQWRKDGTDLTGETAATLTINNVQAGNAGSYDVRVSNDVGTVLSDPATLAVNTPTTATPLVNIANACPGQAASFTTTASGTGPFSYVWRKDGSELTGENGNSLALTVTPSSAGTYCVEVTGACSSVTNCATLTIAQAPAITSQPQNQTTPMGNTATFSVTATGGTPLSYQWQLNGSDISGANAATLNVANATLAQNGNAYSVIVSNCVGSVTSAVAILTVTPIAGVSFDFDSPGQFTNNPYYMVFNDWVNSAMPSVPFESATGGVGPAPGSGALDLIQGSGADNTSIFNPLTYDFSLQGKTLIASAMFKAKAPTANNRSTQLGFITTPTLGIADTTPQAFMTVILQSTAQPALTYELRQQRRLSGGGLTESTLTPTATLTAGNWYKLVARFANNKEGGSAGYTIQASLQDMGPLGTTPGTTNLSFNVGTNFVNADLVNARNVYLALRGFETTGVDFRDNIYVHTTTGPIAFVAQPTGQTVLQGRRAVFRVLVDGTGPYTYQWYKNGSLIPGARSWKYVTPPTLLSDDTAQYTVNVTGPANSLTSAPVTLTVQAQELAVLSAGSVDGCDVGVRFNQPVDRTTAENPANYLINGVAPLVARLHISSLGASGPDGIGVILTPASPLSGAFTVTVQNVQDLSGGVVGVNNSANGTVAGLIGFDVNPTFTLPPGQNYSFAPGQFEITGGGADIWNNADSFRYVYTQKTGDFDIKTRIPALNAVRGPSKAGFDVRHSLDPLSPQILAAANPQFPGRNFIEGTFEMTYNVLAAAWGINAPIRYPDVWLRMRRVGNTFYRYSSPNGTTWTFDGQLTPSPAMPDTIYFGLAVCAVANGTACTAQFENYGDFAGYPGATIAITTQPVSSATVDAGSSTNLSVVATVTGAPATGELAYLWQRSNGSGGWTNIPTAGTTNNVLNTGPLFAADNGAQYRCVIKAAGATDAISDVAAITVNDATAPTLTSASAPPLSTFQVILVFSEPVSSATALNAANYSVTNGVGVSMGVASAAFSGGDPRIVLLTTTSQLVSGSYGVVVNNVQDLAGNTIAADTVRTFNAVSAPGQPVVVELYMGVGGGDLPALTNVVNTPRFQARTPDSVVYNNVFGFNAGLATFPDTGLNNYGGRIYSYFVAPSSGLFRFYIRSDDASQVFMNTNATGNSLDPAGAVLIVQRNGANANYGTAADQLAQNVPLVGGRRYYLEARFKEGGGGDGFALAVQPQSNTGTPGATVVVSGNSLEYPSGVAPATPVLVDYFGNFSTATPSLASFNTLTNDSRWNADTPDPFLWYGYNSVFGFNIGLADSTRNGYGARLRSYFVAPSNGLYRFWIRVDDTAQLFMNTNALNSTDPAGAVLIASQNNFNANYITSAQNVPLNAGQRYYIEARFMEGGGGDGFMMAVRAQDDATTPPNTEVARANLFEHPMLLDRAVGAMDLAGITPLNPTISDGQTIAFAALGVRGAPPYTFTWLKNGQHVAANTTRFTTQPLTASDNGAVFSLLISNAFSRVERSSTVTVLSDSTPPTIASAIGSQYQDIVILTFSELIEPVSGACAPNYRINNGVTVLSASYDYSTRNRVILRTTPQIAGTVYTVTINGVRDASSAGNVIAANSMANFTAWVSGGCGFYVEIFTNIAGTAVANLTADLKYLNNLPDVTGYVGSFSFGTSPQAGITVNNILPAGVWDNYGVRLSGYFMPPSNGLYRFYIRGDDGTQLLMNTNGPDASGRVLIARNDGANSSAYDNGTGGSFSPALSLSQGTAYYVEALMKEGGGGDYVTVAFRAIDPGTLTAIGGVPPTTEVASGLVFAAPGSSDFIQFFVNQAPPSELFVTENDTVNLSLAATYVPPTVVRAACFQWQRYDSATMTFTNIPGALNSNLNFIARLSDDNAQLRLQVSLPGTNTSFTTLLHVAPDMTAPYIVSASSLNGTTIGVCFNELVSSGTLTDEINWSVNGTDPQHFTVIDAVAKPDAAASSSRTVLLTLSTPISGAFTIYAHDMYDTAETPNGASSSTNGVVQGFVAQDVGAPVAVGSSFTCKDGEIDVIAGGNDIWGTSDVGHLTLTPRTGNFNVYLRVQSLTRPDAIAKAGLMIRETFDANSRTLHCLINPPAAIGGRDQGEAAQRVTVGGTTAAWPGSATYIPVGIPNAWIRIQRIGNTFTAYRGLNGIDWTPFGSTTVALSNTVLIGLATTAHTASQAANLFAAAEYRNIYVPNPPTILVQPSPASQTVAIHNTVNYSVVVSNPPNSGPLTYQWKKNGVAIAGATTDTLTLNNAMVTDSGTYTVEVGNDGGVTTSDAVTLTVANQLPVVTGEILVTTQNMVLSIDATNLLANDLDPEGDALTLTAVSGIYPVTFNADFESGLPANTAVYGTAVVDGSGGVGGSGVLKLTQALGSQGGTFIINDLTPGKAVSAFTARFKVLITGGSGNPADGFSLSFANDLPNAHFGGGEEGAGNGLIVAFDNYDNGGGEAPAVDIKWAGATIGHVLISKIQNPNYLDVLINLDADGTLDVSFGGSALYSNFATPYAPITGGRFGLAGRTGGEFETHWVDDLNITVLTRDTALGGQVTLVNGVVNYNPGANVCAQDTFYYIVSDGQLGGTSVGEVAVRIYETTPTPLEITTQPASQTVQAGSTATFTVVASGRAPFTYQWRKDGVGLAVPSEPSLSIPNAQVTDAGGYSVVVGDSCFGSVTSLVATLTVNRAPIAGTDGFGTPRNTPLNIPAASLLANDSDPDMDPLTVTAVSPSSGQGGTVVLSSDTVTYTPPAGFVGGDSFTYTIEDGRGGSAVGSVWISVTAANLAFADPVGGWTYLYTADAAAGAPRTANQFALDGTWRHSNGSDEWFGDGRGAGNGPAGGVSLNSGVISIEDAVTSTSGTTNNRKLFFTHDVRQNGVTGNGWMDAGVTLSFRARLTPADGLNEISVPNGYGIFSGGKGMFGLRQSSPAGMISFSLVRQVEDLNPTVTLTNPAAGLLMNRLNGDATSGAVNSDTGAGGPTNLVALDPTQWHEFWITIQTNDATAGNGTHTVRIYVDGSASPQVFNVTAGNGSDNDTTITPNWTDYITMGLNNSATLGAYDVDFYAFKAGAAAPNGFNDPVAIVSQPANIVVTEGMNASFSVGVSGTPPYFFQWFENGLPIAGATNSSYTRVATTCTDDGKLFHVVVSNLCSTATSSTATLTVLSETTPPAVASARTDCGNANALTVTFSEPVQAGTGDNPANYAIVNSLGEPVMVSAAAFGLDTRTIVLTTTPAFSNDTVYTLTVNNVQDRACTPNTIAANSMTVFVFAQGVIERRLFSGIGGTLVSDLTNHTKFINNQPDEVTYPGRLEGPVDVADNYGTQFRGYLIPPISGTYVFYISADDQAALYLSSDENPANKVQLAIEPAWNGSRNWTGTGRRQPNGTDGGMANRGTNDLVAGKRYFIEVLHKEGGGGDNIGVAWQKPGGPVPANGSAPIPGDFLSSLAPSGPVTIGMSPGDRTINEGQSTTFTVSGLSGTPPYAFQWYKDNVAIAGATGQSYTFGPARATDEGAQFTVTVMNCLGSATSSPAAILHVIPDMTPPTLVSVGSLAGTQIGVCFDEPVTVASAQNTANYSVNGGAVTVDSATLRADARSVILSVSGLSSGSFTVTASGIVDSSVAANVGGGTASGTVLGMSSMEIGNPLPAGTNFTCKDWDIEITAGGADVWGASDQFHFVSKPVAGDFDVRVRVESLFFANTWSKSGLMARETFAANSRTIQTYATPAAGANQVESGVRRTTGGNTDDFGTPPRPGTTFPNMWVRLVRSGNAFSVYNSTDGLSWNLHGQTTEAGFPSTLNVGVFATSHDVTRSTVAQLRSLHFAPVITTQPQSQSVLCHSNVTFTVVASGDGPLTYQWYFNGSPIAGATSASYSIADVTAAHAGAYSVVVSDPYGSTPSPNAVLTVLDVTPPTINCPANMTVGAESGTCSAVVTYTPTASDDCDLNPMVSCVPASGSSFAVGTTTVNCTATDAGGNSNTCSFTVRVVDTAPPTLCNEPAVFFAAGGTNDNFTGPEATAPSASLRTYLSGVDFKIWDEGCFDTFLAHTIGGLPANIAEARLRIRMRACTGFTDNDTISLLFAGPSGFRPERWSRRIGSSGLNGAPWIDGMVREFVLDLSRLPNSDGSFTDLVPALSQERFLDLYVQDDTLVDYVILEVKTCRCQDDITVEGNCGGVVNYTAPAFTDLCSTNVTVVCSPPSGSFFPPGTTVVTCTATDSSGNTARCVFNVTVSDPPVVLRITRQGSNAVIIWPVTCNTYSLEQSTTLHPGASWQPVGGSLAVENGEYRMTVPRSATQNRFYRLRRM